MGSGEELPTKSGGAARYRAVSGMWPVPPWCQETNNCWKNLRRPAV